MTLQLKKDGDAPRTVSRIVNEILAGKINSTGTVTLATSTTTTVVSDFRCSIESTVLFQPTTANAATAYASVAFYAVAAAQSFTINHASATETNRTLNYVLLG